MIMSGTVADMLKYAQCMRSHGVVGFPDPLGARLCRSGATHRSTK
jgi:hypothetical protein